MKITLENTTKIVELNGIPARLWEGKTETGIEVHAFITRIAVKKDADCSQFEKELKEQKVPSPDVAAIPLRLII